MFDTDEDSILGRVVDEIDGELDQVDQDRQNLYDYDMMVFLNSLDSKMSEAYVNDYLEQFKEEGEAFWENVLKKIIKIYHLNNLKFYVTEVKIDGFNDYVSELVYDLKVRLPRMIEDCKISRDIIRDDFETYLVSELYSKLLIWSVKFIDRESYKRFTNQIFGEAFSQESEDAES